MSLLEGGKSGKKQSIYMEENKLKCYKTQLIDVDYKSFRELFTGFDTIKAITFSYDIKFIDEIMEYFKYGEIIFGADFMVQKDTTLNECLARIYQTGREIGKYSRVADMVASQDLIIHTPDSVLDHRKLYLLKSDDGRTRVIKPSANMTRRAWSGNQLETYDYDDTLYGYKENEIDFENAWINSREIPASVVSSKEPDNLIEGNPVLKGVKETNKTIILKEQPVDEFVMERIKFTIDCKRLGEEYGILLGGVNTKAKNGLYEITAKTLEKIENNQKKQIQRAKVTCNNIEKPYPSLTYDYGNKEAYMNGNKLDLTPSKEEVMADIDELLGIFENFNDFVDENDQLKGMHYKLVTILFASPHIAKLRCTLALRDCDTSSLPLFLMESSSRANCGKTFTTKVILKMMTGEDIQPINVEECKKDYLRSVQSTVKGTPFFLDELNNGFLSRIKDMIKHPEKCEENQLESQPMIVFATNDVTEPEETLRKRMVFLKFDGALPGSIDQNSYKSRSNAILKRIGTAFYREYTRHMLQEISGLLDYIIHEKHIPDNWYPDITNISSKVILSILMHYGYSIPRYMRELTWNGDYFGANCIARNAILEIEAEYRKNRQAFTITKESVTIELYNSKESAQKLESWKNTLPAEMKAEYFKNRDYFRLTLDRKTLESYMGFNFKLTGFFRR